MVAVRLRVSLALNLLTILTLWGCGIGFVVPSDGNLPPIVDAGGNQTVEQDLTVTLGGSATDPEGATDLTYSWSQIEGTAVTLADSTSPITTFTAPDVTGDLVFALSVSDGRGLSTSQVTVSVTKDPTLVGPYADISRSNVRTLSDLSVSGAVTSSRTSPLEADRLTITGALSTSSKAIFIRCNELVLSGGLSFQTNGDDGGVGGNPGSGSGGDGGGGGGSGAPGLGADGGDGGTAADGEGVGTNGVGFAATYASGYSSYGFGGAGSSGTDSAGTGGDQGNGANGAGGGGGGGAADGGTNGGGGGGGGGGLIVVVCNSITGTGTAQSMGGDGGAGNGGAGAGGGGGGGVIWGAFGSYSNNISTNVTGGTGNTGGEAGLARVFDLNLTSQSFSGTW